MPFNKLLMCGGASVSKQGFDWTREISLGISRQLISDSSENVLASFCTNVGSKFSNSYSYDSVRKQWIQYPRFIQSGDRIGTGSSAYNIIGDVYASEYSDVNSFVCDGNASVFTERSISSDRIFAQLLASGTFLASKGQLSTPILNAYPSTSTQQFALGFAFNNDRSVIITPVYVTYAGSIAYSIFYTTAGFRRSFARSNIAEAYTGTTPLHTKMCWTGKHFVVIRTSPTLATAARIYMHTSTDGINWTTKDRFVDFAFGGTAFIPTIAKSVSGKDDKILISFTDAFDPRALNSKIVYSTDAGNTFAVHDQPGPVSIPEVDSSPGYFTANSSIWDDKYSKFILVGCMNFPSKKVAAITTFDGSKFDKPTIIADSKISPTAYLTEAFAINYTSNKYFVGGNVGVYTSPR